MAIVRRFGSAIKRAAVAVVWSVAASACLAATTAPATSVAWPQFHGPQRDNVSGEKGLLKQWPADGPKLLWKSAECGGGYSSVSIADGRIFTSGDFGADQYVLALSADGAIAWKTPNGASWKGAYPGARATPTWAAGAVYHVGPHGRLAAFDAGTGRELWFVDLKKTFESRAITWALAENLLVDGDVLYCAPGGAKGRIVALDKATGNTLWANTEIAESAAYCSPILFTHGGVRQLVTVMQKSVVSVEARTGKLLWRHAHAALAGQNVTMPVWRDGCVLVSSGHATGSRLLKLDADGRSIKQVWAGEDLDNCHGGIVLLGDHVYGSGCRLHKRGLVCVEFATGKTLWNEAAISKLSLTWADGMLYALDADGKMMLMEVDPRGCRIVSQFRIPESKKYSVFAHPVVCDGRLYVRSGTRLFAFDVRDPGHLPLRRS
jgi:outer membrane protein assembly factor BamB